MQNLINQEVFFLYICVFNCRYIFGSTCSVILLSLQQCTSTVYTDSHKLGVWGKILSHNSAVIYVKIIIEHWEELGRIALYVTGRNLKLYPILPFCMHSLYMKHVERHATSPASYLLQVDAVPLNPQMCLQAWHAWLSRWQPPWRQRAWPVLAHSVTSTVPTYRQVDTKQRRHLCCLPLLKTVSTRVRTWENTN